MSKLETNTIAPSTGTTLTLGESGDTVQVGTGATNNLGITEVDQWRITANHSGVSVITANWERVDTYSYGGLGTGMTESSGIFTFPSTGIYRIDFFAAAVATGGSSDYMRADIDHTEDNGTYNTASVGYAGNDAGIIMLIFQYFLFLMLQMFLHIKLDLN